MKKAILLLLLLVVSTALVFGQDAAQQDEPDPRKRIKINVQVVNPGGTPQKGVLVIGQAVGGQHAESLTDKDGKCGLVLRPGSWVVKAVRLGSSGSLARREINLTFEDELNLRLIVGADNLAGRELPDSPRLDRDLVYNPLQNNPIFRDKSSSEEIAVDSLTQPGKEVANELSLFTDTVLMQARQRILDQLATKNFSTSYWIENQPGGSGLGGTTSDSYRLDMDWTGGIRESAGSRRQGFFDNLAANKGTISQVALNVTINVPSPSSSSFADSMRFGNEQNEAVAGSGRKSLLPDVNIGDFLTGGDELPDQRMGFEFGSSGASLKDKGDSTFRAFYNEINNRIVNLYRPLRDAYISDIYNSDDTIRGVEFGVEKTFIGGLLANVHYSYSEAGGLDIRTVNLHFEDLDDFESFLSNGLRHDLSTTLEAAFSPTGTKVRAIYRMYLADVEEAGIRDSISNLMQEHSRIDVSLQQRIDFGLLSKVRVSLSLAVNNIMNHRRNNLTLPLDPEDENNLRKLLGGIRIEF